MVASPYFFGLGGIMTIISESDGGLTIFRFPSDTADGLDFMVARKGCGEGGRCVGYL